MSTYRKLKIGKTQIRKSATDPDFLEAFAFSLIIKREYVNSIMYDFSIRKVMSTCGCNYAKAIKIINDAQKFELVKIQTYKHDGKQRKCLVAKHLYNLKGVIVELFICNNEQAGKKLFLATNNVNTQKKYECSKKEQKFKDVKDLILMSALLPSLWRYTKSIKQHLYDTVFHTQKVEDSKKLKNIENQCCGKRNRYKIREAIERYRETHLKMGETDRLNRGWSHKKMLDIIFNDEIKKPILRRLLNKLKAEGHVIIKKNVVAQYDFNPQNDVLTPNLFKEWSEHENQEVSMVGRVYRYKGKTEETHVIYLKRMANTYLLSSHCVRKAVNYKTIGVTNLHEKGLKGKQSCKEKVA